MHLWVKLYHLTYYIIIIMLIISGIVLVLLNIIYINHFKLIIKLIKHTDEKV